MCLSVYATHNRSKEIRQVTRRGACLHLCFSHVTPCSLVDVLLTFQEKALHAPSEHKNELGIAKSDVNVGRQTAEVVVEARETGVHAQVDHRTVCRNIYFGVCTSSRRNIS